MPSKPVKHGLKFWIMACSGTSYVWKIQPYLGRSQDSTERSKNVRERVVFDFIDGLKGHNVTMDNLFSSYELGQKLLSKGLIMVGTM